MDNGTIPAKIRYESGEIVTICPDSIITNVPSVSRKDYVDINIRLPKTYTELVSVELTDTYGNSVLTTSIYIIDSQFFTITTSGVNPGLYLLTIKTTDQIMSKKVIIVK